MSSGTARPFVLVPGACLGGWAWKDVDARLRAESHDVHPVTLTGLGDRAHLASREIGVETHIEDVLAVLDYEDLHDAVLVGHSYSGVIVGAVANRRPERLDAVAYLDTGPLPDGLSIADVQPPELRERQRRDAEEEATVGCGPFPTARPSRAASSAARRVSPTSTSSCSPRAVRPSPTPPSPRRCTRLATSLGWCAA